MTTLWTGLLALGQENPVLFVCAIVIGGALLGGALLTAWDFCWPSVCQITVGKPQAAGLKSDRRRAS